MLGKFLKKSLYERIFNYRLVQFSIDSDPTEDEIDEILKSTFPASDSPKWPQKKEVKDNDLKGKEDSSKESKKKSKKKKYENVKIDKH